MACIGLFFFLPLSTMNLSNISEPFSVPLTVLMHTLEILTTMLLRNSSTFNSV